MIPVDSQQFESYIPVYDTMPDKWEDAKGLIVEQLKKLANGANIREIGWFLDEELLTGKAYIPGVNDVNDGGTSSRYRSILRKVIEFFGLTPGVNLMPHGIFIDANFKLIEMFGSATNMNTLTGEPLPNGLDTVSYDVNNVIVTVAGNYTYATICMEYIQEP